MCSTLKLQTFYLVGMLYLNRTIYAKTMAWIRGSSYSWVDIFSPNVRIQFNFSFKANEICGDLINIQSADRIKEGSRDIRKRARIHSIKGKNIRLMDCEVDSIIGDKVTLEDNCRIKEIKAHECIIKGTSVIERRC